MKEPKQRSKRCQICRHPERTRIKLMRARGVSLDAIASRFNVGRDAVNRETGTSVLDHLHAIRVVLFSHRTTATEAGDGNLAANVAGRLTHFLETIARISGELGALATNTTYNITNNQLVLTQTPAFLQLQASLLHALAPYPEARAAAVTALRDLDDANAARTVPAVPALPKPMVIKHESA